MLFDVFQALFDDYITFVGVSIIEHMVSQYLVILLYSILKYHDTILANTTHPYKVHDMVLIPPLHSSVSLNTCILIVSVSLCKPHPLLIFNEYSKLIIM